MALQSATLTLLIGPTVAVPVPPDVLDALDRVQVSTADTGRSGFQLRFSTGRSGTADLVDHPLLTGALLAPFSRVVILVNLGGAPQVLMDGVITHRELIPGASPGSGILTITGEDVSVMMDLEEKIVEHPAQDEATVATLLIAAYADYGLVPDVTQPPSTDRPTPVERVPVQRGTDLAHLRKMARRFGYVFYVVPGPAPMTNTAHWGPPVRTGTAQPALSVDLGADTNVVQIAFRSDGLAPTKIVGRAQDRLSDDDVAVQSNGSLRPTLSVLPDWQGPHVRTTLFGESGLTTAQAQAQAQGAADASTDSLTATGTLDALMYGGLLTARGLVDLRGAGWTHDGLYYVKRVTHHVARGEYTQDFVLTRDGVGSTVATVRS